MTDRQSIAYRKEVWEWLERACAVTQWDFLRMMQFATELALIERMNCREAERGGVTARSASGLAEAAQK